MTTVVITRPAADAAALVDAVSSRGLQPLVEPMLAVEHIPGPPPDLAGAQALLFTSANGVRAFAARTEARTLPAFAVGDATAAAARLAGFAEVASAAGSVADLGDLVLSRCSPDKGHLLHASGEHVAGDLAGFLGASGFLVQRLILYATRPAQGFSGALSNQLCGGTVRASLFFSPRSGSTFARLVGEAKLIPCCRPVAALCISRAVADSIANVQWRTLTVAARPTQSAMIDLLDQAFPNSSSHDSRT